MKRFIISLFIMTFLIGSEMRPLSMQPFDSVNESYTYQRGSYLILLPEGLNETFLTNENYGGDFVKFKKSQGFDVAVETVSNSMSAQDIKDDIIIPFYNNSSGMLEYVLLVGDVNGKIFSFDLHSYMSLKKLANGSDAKVTAHLHKTQRGTDRGVLIFRDEKGNTTAVLASRSDSTKVVTEATKFKNEFSTSSKVFADSAQPTSSGGRGFPKWEDLNLNKDTNVFRGLELMDLVKMFKDLSTNDVVSKLPRYRPSMGGRPLGLFYPVGKGKIVLNKQLFENMFNRKDYKGTLEDIMMTMAHELGHYIDIFHKI